MRRKMCLTAKSAFCYMKNMISLQTRTPLLLLPILVLITIPSCDKPDRLTAEAATLESQRKLILAESDGYDQRLRATNPAGAIGDTRMLEVQKTSAQKKAADAELKLQKWSAYEERLKPLKEKAAAYKSKYP